MSEPTSTAEAVRGEFNPTGHTAVDRALTELEQITASAVDEHAGLYQEAHERLTEVLDAPVNAVPANGAAAPSTPGPRA
ncbi:hypothetical protein GWK18_10130 [Kocuria sp. JC486]|uniref:hypothetical protein n=1 Tax=Kocuria sp. JC486 TaxID=1970736 RepID=UPI00142336EF|nr:hypothetical protein [Kocuria sp. JC486]NHU85935.1 hypothetical protein [Kocuria sp. JC486]